MLRRIFQYYVEPDNDRLFNILNGPKGDWEKFFKKSDFFIDTQLLKDEEQPGKYVTLDMWVSREKFDEHVSQNQGEYDDLCARNAELYSECRLVGNFEDHQRRFRVGFFDHLIDEDHSEKMREEVVKPIKQSGYDIDYCGSSHFTTFYKKYDLIIMHLSNSEIKDRKLQQIVGRFVKQPVLILGGWGGKRALYKLNFDFPHVEVGGVITPDTIISFIKEHYEQQN